MNRLPSDYQDFLKTRFGELYLYSKCREHQVNRIIESFAIGFSPFDNDERFLILRFQCPILLTGRGKNAELQSLHKIIRIVWELIFQIIRKYDTGHISDIFYDLDMMELDTASFLYFLHENLSSLNVEQRIIPSLGELCVTLSEHSSVINFIFSP